MTNMKIYDGDKIIQMVNLKLDDTIQPHKYSAHFIFTSFFIRSKCLDAALYI